MKTSQMGLSLIELMISMTIALFLTLGLGVAFYGMTTTSKTIQGIQGQTNKGLSGLQDSERMAMLFLGNGIKSAGYFAYFTPPPTTPFVANTNPFSAGTGWAAGQFISGTTGVAPASDTLSVRYQGNGTSGQGCAGNAVSGTVYTDTFSIASNALQCTENGTIYTLVTGISAMTILYGVYATTPETASEYLTAGAVANWSKVVSINIQLTLINPLAGQSGQLATLPFSETFPVMNGQ
jgi:type IV pilus assembly protein PilW